jgi:predicted HAD superfamily Cof-like phosphohydrolase
MTTITEMLHEFHTRPGVDVGAPDHPTLDVEGLVDRQLFLLEEYIELRDALELNDLVAVADALGDMKYVIHGTAWRTGINLVETSTEYHLVEMPSTPTLRVDGLDLQVRLLEGRVRQLSAYLVTGNLEEFASTLSKLDHAVDVIAWRAGIPLLEVVREIHASNMTKTVSPGDNKAIKGPDYRPPDVAGVLAKKAARA